MKELVAPGTGEWPFGIGLAKDTEYNQWALYATSPCCFSRLVWNGGARVGKVKCVSCAKFFAEGFSDTFHVLDEGLLDMWVASWLGFTHANVEQVEVEVTW